jgi:hypothetical protein
MIKLVFTCGRSASRCLNRFITFSRLSVLALAVAIAWPVPARATPYASGISNNAGTVSFVLNESADSVSVLLDAGASTLDLGALNKGRHSFSLGGATSFQIVVRKIAAANWALISDDSNPLLLFNSPRGVAVNLNTNSPAFGRIYVANSAVAATGRPTGDGLYLLNADQSDALGRADAVSTAGIVFTSGAQQASTPWHMEVGPDDFLYIADFSTNTGTIYRTDADVSAGSGVNIFTHYGITNQTVHTTIGSSPIVRGSLANNDLMVWAIDGRFPGTGNNNRLFRWDINGGPLPHNTPPAPLANPLITTTPDITTDLDRGPDGKFYLMQNRSVGNESGIVVTDTDGVTILWRSLTETRSISNNPSAVDILRLSRAVKISPDGSKMAIIRDDLQTWIVPLINGIPDLINRELVATYSGPATTLGRDVCWDAAGNLYALSSGNLLLRVFSPGGATTATTGSDGTFNLAVVPLPIVTVTSSSQTSSGDLPEAAPDAATFTLARTGDPAEALTVNYQFSGTASNGLDYVTTPLSVTFSPGASSATVTITPIDDAVAEFTESVVLSLLPGTNYTTKVPNTATINIIDNEYPNVLTVAVLDTNSFERFTNDVFTFRVTRYGDTNVETFINLTLTGGAAENSDFRQLTAPVYLGPGISTMDIGFSPLDDAEFEGDETVIFTLVSAPDYDVGNPGSATNRIRDDEFTPAPVLFSDNFETDTSADWIVRFGANNGIYDATNAFAYDYVAAGIPLAPRSGAGTGKGLFVAVNKYNATALGSAGINLYPSGKTFSGDFALRFDMFLSLGTVSTTEHVLAGLNHSSLLTNRVTQSTDANNTTAGGDGIWVAIESDASVNRDYTAYTTTNQANAPVIIASRSAASMAPFVTSPPYAFAGSPGVGPASAKEWSNVELSQVANVITLKVNATTVFTVTNTSGYTSGDVMLGMNDQFDSVGSVANYVIFDNVEVVSLGSAINVTGISFPSPNVVAIDFASSSGGSPADFHLQSTGSLAPVAWADDDSAAITATANGYRATTTRSGDARYYRIRR